MKQQDMQTSNQMNFPQMEERALIFWEANHVFEKILQKEAPRGNFVFFEGPPSANGVPGLHHVLARVFKDIMPRFKTMQGYRVERKAGWDTHGLPVELQVQKELGIHDKKEIEQLKATPTESIIYFNDMCREAVLRYKAEWEKLTRRIAFWLDMEHPYLTYSNEYIESLWWVFRQMWDTGLVYQDYKVLQYCPSCGTALSSHEVAQGYDTVSEDSVYVKFKAKGMENTYFLVWTTTPWTLVGNVALALGATIHYVKIQVGNEYWILAKSRLAVVQEPYTIIEEYTGTQLLDIEYESLYDFFTDSKNRGWYTLPAEFVSTEEGTGIVHLAWYGEEDYEMIKKFDLPWAQHINNSGRVIPDVDQWQGLWFKDLDKEVVQDISKRGLLYRLERYEHEYPFCWRCDTPLLYHATTSWFIHVSSLREQLLKNNEAIHWIPSHTKHGRFGEWLAGAKDWAISRERYWGTPLPIWVCDSCGEKVCIGSLQELHSRAEGKQPTDRQGSEDLHRPYIDAISFICKICNGVMHRVPEVLDVWFDSGAMPFAQWHYPFENQNRIDQGISFPADFIAEAIDQTRGWFYTLLVVSTLLSRGAPYKHVISLGHIRDKFGKKMSKSKGNVVNPLDVINRYGADTLRWHLYTINAPGEYKDFDILHVDQVFKKVLLILWNVVTFYQTYADPLLLQDKYVALHILDRWIIAKKEQLVFDVTHLLEEYDIFNAARRLQDFITDLSTWYIRRSRSRFRSEKLEDRKGALNTLYCVLFDLAKLLAPFMPFIAEEIYQKLKPLNEFTESVHLSAWPSSSTSLIDTVLLSSMETVRHAVSLALEQRAQWKIPVRQVLSKVTLFTAQDLTPFLSIIAEEVNVQEVKLVLEEDSSTMRVELATEITSELKELGLVRELVRQVNALRKKAGLTRQDRVSLVIDIQDPELRVVIVKFQERLTRETSSEKVIFGRLALPENRVSEILLSRKSVWLGLQ